LVVVKINHAEPRKHKKATKFERNKPRPPTTTKKQKQQASAQTQTWSGGEAVSSWLRGRKNFDARPQSIAIDVDAVIIHKLHENKLHKTPLITTTQFFTGSS
jgi:hypothetical protein